LEVVRLRHGSLRPTRPTNLMPLLTVPIFLQSFSPSSGLMLYRHQQWPLPSSHVERLL
jgi:hypothetical protein